MKKTIRLFLILVILILAGLILLGGGFGTDRTTQLNKGEVTIFAHKGESEHHVANSFPAIERSKKLGFKAIEIDINSTSDGKLILFHDDTCNRLLGIDEKIRNVNWDSIKNKKLWFDWRPTSYSIVSLEQFLNKLDDSTLIYLDIKAPTKVMADSLVDILVKFKTHKNILIANSNLLFLTYMKWNLPSIKTVLEGFDRGKEWVYYLIPKNFKPNFYACYLKYTDQEHMQFFQQNDLLKNYIIYGVDSSNISRVYELGIQNIILDYTDTLGSLEAIHQKILEKKLQH